MTNPAMTPWRSSAAICLARIGQRDRAVALADVEIGLAQLWGAARAIGVAQRAAGMVRDGREGLESSETPSQLSNAHRLLLNTTALSRPRLGVWGAGYRAEGGHDKLRWALDLATGSEESPLWSAPARSSQSLAPAPAATR